MPRMLTRNEFCALRRLSFANLDNLTRAGQLPLAFGLNTPAVMGQYHPMDVVANALADALVERGFPRETAARILRDHHETWLFGLTRAEWELSMVSYNARGEKIADRQIYFAVARTRRGKAEMFRTAAGLPDEVLKNLRQAGPATDMVFLNFHDVLHAVRDAFHEHGLLEEFVVGSGANMPIFTRHPKRKAEFDAWRDEIRRYREQSIDRLKARERVRRERKRAKAVAT